MSNKQTKAVKQTKGVKKPKETIETTDPLGALMTMTHFNEPIKKKQVDRPVKAKELEIDLEHDSQEEIIKKLVANNKVLREELRELRNYVDGTFCTFAIHSRFSNDTEKKLDELSNAIENMV